MVIVFDLDDTLYDETSYVIGGLKAVSNWGAEKFNLEPTYSLEFMVQVLLKTVGEKYLTSGCL